MSRDYSIDLDLGKMILACPGVKEVLYRLSASGRGFHFRWTCSKRWCKHCSRIEKEYDDVHRYRHDQQRPKANRRILWDKKGNRRAAEWLRMTKKI